MSACLRPIPDWVLSQSNMSHLTRHNNKGPFHPTWGESKWRGLPIRQNSTQHKRCCCNANSRRERKQAHYASAHQRATNQASFAHCAFRLSPPASWPCSAITLGTKASSFSAIPYSWAFSTSRYDQRHPDKTARIIQPLIVISVLQSDNDAQSLDYNFLQNLSHC